MPILKIDNNEFCGMRLDKFLTLKISEVSRSKIQKMLKEGKILVNGKPSKSNYSLAINDEIYLKGFAKDDLIKKEKIELKMENINLEVLYEDKEFFVIDKPYGMVVHPSETGHRSGTVVNAVLKKVDKLHKENLDSLRPGIVHRLDKDTSGILLITKTKEAYDYFINQFKHRSIKKFYLALVLGTFDYKEGLIDSPIGRDVMNRQRMSIVSKKEGKQAISGYKVLKEFKLSSNAYVSLVEVELKTGRTHQIRVHMQAVGHPVICDEVYGIESFNEKFSKEFGLNRQFLHAYKMSFKNPSTGKVINIESKLPEALENILKELKTL